MGEPRSGCRAACRSGKARPAPLPPAGAAAGVSRTVPVSRWCRGSRGAGRRGGAGGRGGRAADAAPRCRGRARPRATVRRHRDEQTVVNMFSYDQNTIDESVNRFVDGTSGPLRDMMSQDKQRRQPQGDLPRHQRHFGGGHQRCRAGEDRRDRRQRRGAGLGAGHGHRYRRRQQAVAALPDAGDRARGRQRAHDRLRPEVPRGWQLMRARLRQLAVAGVLARPGSRWPRVRGGAVLGPGADPRARQAAAPSCRRWPSMQIPQVFGYDYQTVERSLTEAATLLTPDYRARVRGPRDPRHHPAGPRTPGGQPGSRGRRRTAGRATGLGVGAGVHEPHRHRQGEATGLRRQLACASTTRRSTASG